MPDLQVLMQQRDALDQQIRELKTEMRRDAVRRVKVLIEAHGLSERDVFASNASIERQAVAAKYRDPDSGKTWSGRGRTPKWLEGKNKDEFVI